MAIERIPVTTGTIVVTDVAGGFIYLELDKQTAGTKLGVSMTPDEALEAGQKIMGAAMTILGPAKVLGDLLGPLLAELATAFPPTDPDVGLIDP